MVHFYRIARTDENHAQPVLYIHTNKQTDCEKIFKFP